MALDRTAYDLLQNETAPGSNDGTIVLKETLAEVILDPVDAEIARLDAAIGGGGGALSPRCSLTVTTAQLLAHGAYTVVAFGAEVFDVGGMHDNAVNNSRLTVPSGQGGDYWIGGTIQFDAHASGQRQIQLRNQAGGVLATGITPTNVVTAYTLLPVMATVTLAAGDYVELWAYQDCGISLNISNAMLASLAMFRIG